MLSDQQSRDPKLKIYQTITIEMQFEIHQRKR